MHVYGILCKEIIVPLLCPQILNAITEDILEEKCCTRSVVDHCEHIVEYFNSAGAWQSACGFYLLNQDSLGFVPGK